jgi:hypothetical protein
MLNVVQEDNLRDVHDENKSGSLFIGLDLNLNDVEIAKEE